MLEKTRQSAAHRCTAFEVRPERAMSYSATHRYGRPISVVIADDHMIVIEGLKSILRNEPDIELVGTALTISALITCLKSTHCDVLVCDYSFESDAEPDGLNLFKRLKREFPDLAIIVLTSHQAVASFVCHVMDTGVFGFLRKSSEEIVRLPRIIRSVRAGDKFMDSDSSAAILQNGIRNTTVVATLSERELEVFRMLGQGMTVTEIAAHTNRSVKTVSTQKLKAMRKFGATSDADLYRIYVETFG